MKIKNIIKFSILSSIVISLSSFINFTYANSSEDFILDYSIIEEDGEVYSSDDYLLQGGFTALENAAQSNNYKIVPLSKVSECGNDLIEVGEVCDTNDFNNISCITLGYDSGSLSCKNNCQTIDISSCIDNEAQGSTGNNNSSSGGGSYLVPYYEDQPSEEIPDEPVNEPVYEPVNEPVYEPVYEPVNEPVNEAVYEPVNEAVYEPIYDTGNDAEFDSREVTDQNTYIEYEDYDYLENDYPRFDSKENNETLDNEDKFISDKSLNSNPGKILGDTEIQEDRLNPNYLIISNDEQGKKIFDQKIKINEGQVVFEPDFELPNGTYDLEIIQNETTQDSIKKVGLGKIIEGQDNYIKGKTIPSSKIIAFFKNQSIFVKSIADKNGDFKIKISNELPIGDHTVDIISFDESNKLLDRFQYEFELTADTNKSIISDFYCTRFFAILILILAMAILSLIILKDKKKKPRKKK
ncbi:hypothetical protein ACFL21_00385 [Patescibacteria group bacterium]